MRVIISCVLLFSLVLSSCTESPSLAPSLAPTFSQSPPPTRTNVPSATAVITATPTLNDKTIILTPDDLFSLPGLKAWSTPASEDFCEHLPPPQIVANPDRLSLLSGRFALCIYERINTAMDLDRGSLVSTDDPGGDIVMFSGRFWTSEKPDYGVSNWNNAYLDDAYVLEKYANHSGANHLSSAYCENMLRGKTDTGAIDVEEGKIACVRTTEGRIALIRVERIYPSNTLSVEFSFAILRTVIATPAITPSSTTAVIVTPKASPLTTNTPTEREREEIDFLLEIQDAVRTDNKEKLASLIYYPITIDMLDGSELKMQNAAEFVANYEKIVIPEWKEIVLAQEPTELFSNWQGAMVHRGELWFTSVCLDETCENTKYYIIAIRQIDWSK